MASLQLMHFQAVFGLLYVDIYYFYSLAELLDLYWSNMSGDELQVSHLNNALALACRVTASSALVIKLLTMGAEPTYIHADIPVIILAVWSEKTTAVEYMLDVQPNLINCTVLNDSVINKHKFEGLLFFDISR